MINVGDKVKIREDLDECTDYGNGVDYVWSMEQYKGKIAKIVDKDSHNLITIDLDDGRHYWAIEMFEDKELTKYKKAFEILKPYIDFPPMEDFMYREDGNYYVCEIDEYDDILETYKTYHYILEKEEYELLEELMKDE